MVTVDALFTVLWLSAFATQAAYNSKDECGKGCSLSKAIVAMGVFVTCVPHTQAGGGTSIPRRFSS